MQVPARRGWLALSPVVVFLLLYMAVSIVLDDFYKMPVSVALMLSSMWAIVIYRGARCCSALRISRVQPDMPTSYI